MPTSVNTFEGGGGCCWESATVAATTKSRTICMYVLRDIILTAVSEVLSSRVISWHGRSVFSPRPNPRSPSRRRSGRRPTNKHLSPPPPDGDRGHKIKPMKPDLISGKCRHDEPEDINKSHRQYPYRDIRKIPDYPLSTTGEKQQERHEEMPDEKNHRDDVPTRPQPF